MRVRIAFAALAAALLAVAPAAGIDFDKVDRHIGKEPAYQAKPLYCLALLGLEGKTLVWMALDGERLYVDKNCNGDLTDDGPQAKLETQSVDPASFDKVEVSPDNGQTVYKLRVTPPLWW